MNPKHIILDTHVWVWAADAHPNVQKLETFEGKLNISAISIWEVSMLVHKKRLKLNPNINSWVDRCTRPPINLIPLEPAISLLSCQLPGTFHGDPADRIIVATALYLKIPLATTDKKIITYAQHNPLKIFHL